MSVKTEIPTAFRVHYGFVVDQFRYSLAQHIEYGYGKVADLAVKSNISTAQLDGFLAGTVVLTVPELKRLTKAFVSPVAELWVTVPIDLVDPAHIFDEPFYRVPPVETD
jgi:hypothetical protein